MKKMKQLVLILGIVFITGISFCGCTKTEEVNNLSDYTTDISNISVDDQVKIVGLGEATHGNVEFQELKKDVFEALVRNDGCRVFAIEGDFGGGLKINEYIHGGAGTAKEASAKLGFTLYRTEQMEELIQWMRDYNDAAAKTDPISFYGFDMQRYDNSKEVLLNFLKQAGCDSYDRYEKGLENLNDDTVYDQKNALIKDAEAVAEEIQNDLQENKEIYIQALDEREYTIACECIQSIIQNTELQLSSIQYATLRDQYMKEHVDWIYQFEGQKKIFITGHDGHIDKSSAVKGYVSMGKLLADEYGDAYFAIGTDFLEGEVNIVTSAGNRKNTSIHNKNNLTALFEKEQENIFYLDFAKAAQNEKINKILNSKQRMVNIGATLDGYQKLIKSFYTLNMVPCDAYDSVIVVKEVTPTAPWQIEE